MKRVKPPKLPLPDIIKLPDGITIPTTTIVNRVKNRSTINLRKKVITTHIPKVYKKPEKYTHNLKYSLEERLWQHQAELSELEQKYTITTKQATQLKWQAGNIVNYLKQQGILDNNAIDTDNKE
jgi:hypothetical protein